MAVKCGHCRGTDIVYAFDTYQCLSCGGYSFMDGAPTVPTSALEVGGTWDGPGRDLIEREGPPVRAVDKVRRDGPVPDAPPPSESATIKEAS